MFSYRNGYRIGLFYECIPMEFWKNGGSPALSACYRVDVFR